LAVGRGPLSAIIYDDTIRGGVIADNHNEYPP